jgi:hypothetical protein
MSAQDPPSAPSPAERERIIREDKPSKGTDSPRSIEERVRKLNQQKLDQLTEDQVFPNAADGRDQ